MLMPKDTYKGYRYEPWDDVEPGECIKIWHEVVTPDGKRISMDWSPYYTPEMSDFQLWIDLGCPNRYDQGLGERHCYGSLDRKDLEKIKAAGGAKPGRNALLSR